MWSAILHYGSFPEHKGSWNNTAKPNRSHATTLRRNESQMHIQSVERLQAVHSKQLLTYLRLTGCRLGLLINFGENLMKDGFKRVANGLDIF